MKKIVFLLILINLLFSCSKNDNDDSSYPEGTWKVTSIKTSIATDINNDGISTTNFMLETNCFNNSYLYLQENKNANFKFQGVETSLNLVSGTTNQYEYQVVCTGIKDNISTWIQDNNTITIVVNKEPKWLVVNGNTSSLTIYDYMNIDFQENNSVVSKYIDVTLELTKQ